MKKDIEYIQSFQLVHDIIGPLKTIEGLIDLTNYRNSEEKERAIHFKLRNCLKKFINLNSLHGIKLSPDDLIDYSKRLRLPIARGFVYVDVDCIVRIVGEGSYCTFHMMNGKKYMISKNMGEYENMLPERHFYRCHTSHIVNMSNVQKFINCQGYFVEMSDNSIIEVSRRKKEEFLARLERLCQ